MMNAQKEEDEEEGVHNPESARYGGDLLPRIIDPTRRLAFGRRGFISISAGGWSKNWHDIIWHHHRRNSFLSLSLSLMYFLFFFFRDLICRGDS